MLVDTSTQDTADGPLCPSPPGEQLLAKDNVDHGKVKELGDTTIPINPILLKIKERAAKLVDIASLKGNAMNKTLPSELLEVKKKSLDTVSGIHSALKHNLDTAMAIQHMV